MTPLSPYSRLFRLEPHQGQVESLTSYLARLADRHGLPLGSLILRELVPAFSCKFLRRSPTDLFTKMGASLNGLGNVAVEGAKIVEGLTSCPGLQIGRAHV